MPLKGFFHGDKTARRSRSQYGGRNSNRNNELSVVPLDDTKMKAAAPRVDVQQNGVMSPSKPKPSHPTDLVHWNSTNSLIRNEISTKSLVKILLSPKTSKPAAETPKRRTAITETSTKALSANASPKLSRKSHSTVRKKLSHSEALSHLEFCAEGYRLTGQQRDLLKLCWRQARERRGEPGRFIFSLVLTRCSHLREVLGVENVENASEDARFQKHLQAFTELFELVVGSVVDEAEESGGTSPDLSLDNTTGPLLHSYGARHATLEIDHGDEEEDLIRPEHWDLFRTAICEYASSAWRQNVLSALSGGSSAQKRNEALHAWRILAYYIVAKVKQGYEIEKNEQRKRVRGRSVAE